MHLFDAVTLGDTRVTRDGYMTANARIARTGIQVYAGAELGRPAVDRVRVYRPEDEVFHQDALASMTHRPVTIEHPAEAVGASNWRQHAVGTTGDQVARDGDWVRVPLVLMDADAIAAVKAGKRQLSVGYDCDIDWTPGVTPDGASYDAVQRGIRGNHLAVVDAARAGPGARIGDQQPPQKEPVSMADQTRAVMVDGVSYQMSDQGAQLLERVQRQLADAQAAMSAKDGEIAGLRTAHASALSAKDGELTAARQAVADAEAKLTPAALDAAVAARSGLLATARRVLGDSFDGSGKTDAEVRRAIVAQRLGDKMPADPDAAFLDGAFRFIDLAGDAAPSRDPIRDTLRTPPVRDAAKPGTAEEAWRSSVQDMTNAWQTAGQQKAH